MKRRRIDWQPEELAWIPEMQPFYRTRRDQWEAFKYRFGRQEVSFGAFAGLCKRNGWLTGHDGRFQKGHTSHNKGRKGYHPPGSEKGWFRPGSRPHTWRGAGHESIDGKDGYVWLIVDERNPYTGAATRRVQKHRWLWEREHGPVPEGHCLKCIDGDRTNTDPSNWECIPRRVAVLLNGGPYRKHLSYDDAAFELKPTVMAIAKLRAAKAKAKAKAKETTNDPR